MRIFTFTHGSATFTAKAANYAEALAALIFEVGSEAEAAKWIFAK
jgi:hypothetical protein